MNVSAAPSDPEAVLLCQIPAMDGALLLRLRERFETPSAILQAPSSELRALGLPPGLVARIVAAPRQRAATEAGLRSLQRMGIRALALLAEDYPRSLLELSHPPLMLYIQGRWPPRQPAVAVDAGDTLDTDRSSALVSLLAALSMISIGVLAGAEHLDLLPAVGSVAVLPFGLLLTRQRVPDLLRDAVLAGDSTLLSLAPVNAQATPELQLATQQLLVALVDGIIWAGTTASASLPRLAIHQWYLQSGTVAHKGMLSRDVPGGEAGAHLIARSLGIRVSGTRIVQQERLW